MLNCLRNRCQIGKEMVSLCMEEFKQEVSNVVSAFAGRVILQVSMDMLKRVGKKIHSRNDSNEKGWM